MGVHLIIYICGMWNVECGMRTKKTQNVNGFVFFLYFCRRKAGSVGQWHDNCSKEIEYKPLKEIENGFTEITARSIE